MINRLFKLLHRSIFVNNQKEMQGDLGESKTQSGNTLFLSVSHF